MQPENPFSEPAGFLSEKLENALQKAAQAAKAAPQPQSLLPGNEVTTSDAQKSHLITHDYIVRLRHAGKVGTLSADTQLAAGAALGLAVPGCEGLYMLFAKRPEMSLVQTLSALFFVMAVAVFIVMKRASKTEESVHEICTEIEKRKTTKA